MQPVHFRAQTVVLGAPVNWNAEKSGPCRGLPVHRDEIENTWHSCWRPSWREAFALLFGRCVWLCVSGGGHPPVSLQVARQNPPLRTPR